MKKVFLETGAVALFSLLFALLMTFSWEELPSEIEVGSIARQDIRADKDYAILDEEKTDQLRQEALAAVEVRLKAREERGEEESEKMREEALAAVKPVVIKVQVGESIIRSGDHFELRHLKIIQGIRKEKSKTFAKTRFLGTFLSVGLLVLVLVYTLQRSSRKIRLGERDLIFVGTLLLALVSLERIILFVGEAVRGFLPFAVPLKAFYGVMPIAAGIMIVRMILPLGLALVFAPLSAILGGLLLEGGLEYTLLYLVGAILAIPLMSNIRNRSHILRVGLQLGGVCAILVLGLDMVNVASVFGVKSLQDTGIRMAFAFLSGPLSAIVVLILMPVFETFFNYLTPIKLLEFGSLNHPILREMIVRAPGTYHHSHMVGTLAEAACEAIGADSLFARVASYFHDIGKMKKSTYFIENQAEGEDRHSQLSPSMSALIIAAHVKEGMDLARDYKLPQRIIDIIPQHQGTKLISYFYSKAKETENPERTVVDERDYRYPGPKPQTREAGVILLADTVEAATRALKDRSAARLEEVVRNMINKNFIDGQLDECELTLKDLHTIGKSFVRILMGIYHQRIEYPEEPAEAVSRDRISGEALADKYHQSKPIAADSLREGSRGTPEGPPKNIRRIGIDRTRN